MNIKKILTISIVTLSVFSCLSIASAGWFDSESDSNEPAKTTVKLNITDSSYNVGKTIVQQAGNSFSIYEITGVKV